MSKPHSYRQDIDGLRAYAVLGVFIFHLSPSWLPGGYLGVDVFFVISGFLISSKIYDDLKTNSFSLKSFYTRRIKRILPAFYFVIAITSLASLCILLPDALKDFSRSAWATTYFGANHYFASRYDYFAPNVSELPLLHTWSLAVEEQFYFIWPLLLMVSVIKLKERRHVLLFILLLIVASLSLGIYWESKPEQANLRGLSVDLLKICG